MKRKSVVSESRIKDMKGNRKPYVTDVTIIGTHKWTIPFAFFSKQCR